MKRGRLLLFVFGEALGSFRRNGWMAAASVSTLMLSLFVFALFLALAVNLQYATGVVESQVQVVAFLGPPPDLEAGMQPASSGQAGTEAGAEAPGAAEVDGEGLAAQIASWNGVAEARFVSKEEALMRLRGRLGDQGELLDAVAEMNPLRDSIEVRIPDAENVETIVARLKSVSAVGDVVYEGETIQRLVTVSRGIQVGGLSVGGLLAVATVFIVANTVRLTVFARRHEIGIMKLVGATDALIRGPFFVEGALIGLAGGLLAITGFATGYDWAIGRVRGAVPFIPLVPPQPFVTNLGMVLLVLGVAIGALGSAISVRRHLRV